MSFVVPLSSIVPNSCFNQFKAFPLKSHNGCCLTPHLLFIHGKTENNIQTIFRKKVKHGLRSIAVNCMKPNYQSNGENAGSLVFGDQEKEEDDTSSPWEGAVIYKRNSWMMHVEYCTTLERLGLGNFSTEVSKSRASAMGLRVTKAVTDYPFGTPVQISVDVTRKKQKLRLDGIVKTVITLGCNRCGGQAAESIFSDFSLLLTELPVEEPEIINLGTIYGEVKSKSYSGIGKDGEDEDDASIDFEDRLYFPPGEKEIDISKHIRDLVHLEININAICDPNCKGMCFKCGKNLNTSRCNCGKQEMKKNPYGPLGNLKQKMKAK